MTFADFQQSLSELSRVPVYSIREDASLRDDLGIDSLQMVNLIVRLTEQFGVDIGQISDMGAIHTVGSMYCFLAGRR
ncbi:acyl carrier protein [Paenibacillus chartarius]|uniref:Acyl carrier protein n=1 Tax=Paenibacillus chartarius TaxID=747481 RepID=A0ABV6DLT0_9BACL